MTFRSFCAIKLVMEAIWSSVLISHGLYQEPEKKQEITATNPKPKVARQLELGGNDSTLEERDVPVGVASQPLPIDAYQTEVMEKLEKACSHIAALFPLQYRLEILENIFSLLFLSSDDMRRLEETEGVVKTDNVSDSYKSTATISSGGESDFLNSINSMTFIRKHRGFLIGERMASDLLNCLTDSIHQLLAAKLFQSGEGRGNMGNEILCSVPNSTFQSRTTKLQKYINEAKWRLQLVSAKSGIVIDSNMGMADMDNWISKGMSSDEDSMSDTSDREDSGDSEEKQVLGRPHKKLPKNDLKSDSSSGVTGPSPIPRLPRLVLDTAHSTNTEPKKRTKERPPPTSVAPPSMDESSDGHCADVEERSPAVPSMRKKKLRSRNSSTSMPHKAMSPSSSKGSGIIYQMLASPESLLCLCLMYANYHKATEVLKLCGMEGKVGESLVQFLEQFEVVSNDLVVHSRNATPQIHASLPHSQL